MFYPSAIGLVLSQHRSYTHPFSSHIVKKRHDLSQWALKKALFINVHAQDNVNFILQIIESKTDSVLYFSGKQAINQNKNIVIRIQSHLSSSMRTVKNHLRTGFYSNYNITASFQKRLLRLCSMVPFRKTFHRTTSLFWELLPPIVIVYIAIGRFILTHGNYSGFSFHLRTPLAISL